MKFSEIQTMITTKASGIAGVSVGVVMVSIGISIIATGVSLLRAK